MVSISKGKGSVRAFCTFLDNWEPPKNWCDGLASILWGQSRDLEVLKLLYCIPQIQTGSELDWDKY
jgi:hypothetical protein